MFRLNTFLYSLLGLALAADDFSAETLGYQVVLADAGATCEAACAALGDDAYTCPFTTAYKETADGGDATKSTAWSEQKIASYDYDTSTYTAIGTEMGNDFRNFEGASKIVLDAAGIKCNKLRINKCPYAGVKTYSAPTGHSNLVMTHECRFPGNNRNHWCDADDVDSSDYDCGSDYQRLCRCGSVKTPTVYKSCGSEPYWYYYDGGGDATKDKCFKSLAMQDMTSIPSNAVSDFSTAAATCKGLGGKLPMPKDEDEWTWFQTNILEAVTPAATGGGMVWFDLTDSTTENYWRSADGETLYFVGRKGSYAQENADYYIKGWNSGEPNNAGTENCAGPAKGISWQWNDVPCRHSGYVVCEKEAEESTANDEDAVATNR